MTGPAGEHLDLDELADVLAGVAPEATEHTTRCAECRAALDDLRVASARVGSALADLPPVTLPADVADRLTAALHGGGTATGTATVTTLPVHREATARTSGRGAWLGAAAAVAVLLAGAGFVVTRSGSHPSASTAAGGASAKSGSAATLNLVRNSTGNDYTTRQSLAAAVPILLSGKEAADQVAAPMVKSAPNNAAGANPQAATDPLARLRSDAGLADCLLALLPPDDPSVRPLALDYAQYKGTPALVVVLPSAVAGKLDVFVVGPGCSRANDSTLFYTSVTRP